MRFGVMLGALAFSTVALPSSPALADTFRDGLRAYNLEDFATARTIWLMLAKRGDARAQSSLGYLYYEGRGVAHDAQAAAKWFYLAAAQDEPTAQSFLCGMHLKGDGVARNLELALMWCELSLAGGETRGTHLRERVLEQMTPQQRDRGMELVAKWRRLQARQGAAGHPAVADDSAAGGRPQVTRR